MNTYGYVRGNPLRYADIKGLDIDWEPDEWPDDDPRRFPSGPFGPHCGTGQGATWIPDGNEQRVQACKNHDKCYGTCANGDPLHKQKCDIQFLDEGGAGLIYFGAVNSTEAAQQAHEQAQKDACKKNEKCGGGK